jgi:flagellar hook-associated protein 3 FlgL
MIQNLNTISQQFLANLQSLQQRIADTQAQVSSGLRISKVSDDPGAVSDVLQLESDIGHLTQVSSNLSAVKGQVDTSESALETATSILLQVQTLAAQGANSTVSASTRAGLAQQVQLVLGQLVSVSQTQFEGRYVFGGDADGQPSYQLDSTSPTGVQRLVQTTATRQIQDATGVTFADAKTAQDIFDHRNPDDSVASDNVFAAVNSLVVALADNDQTGINNAIDSINASSDYLGTQLAFYGRVQDRVATATDLAQKFQLQYQTALSGKKDTDMASAAVDLSQEQTSMQAAIQAQASLPRTSLFNLINNGG